MVKQNGPSTPVPDRHHTLSAHDRLLQTVYANLNNINRSIQADFDAIMSRLPTPLSATQIMLLTNIYELPAPVRAKQLAEILRLTPGAISQVVDFLHNNGYLLRTDSPTDRRVANLSLTAKGQRTVERSQEAYTGLIKRAMANLSDDELEHLAHIQHKILQHMQLNETESSNHATDQTST